MNHETRKCAKIRAKGFVSHELGCALASLMICIALCLPLIAAMRDRRISPLVGLLLIAAICLLFLVPKMMNILSERSWRRRMKAREQEEQEQSKIL